MTTDPAEHTPHIVATYQVRHASSSPTQVARDVLVLLAAGVRLIDLSDHDRRANIVTLRTNGTANGD